MPKPKGKVSLPNMPKRNIPKRNKKQPAYASPPPSEDEEQAPPYPKPAPLRQVQYRSYTKPIQLYHYAHHAQPIRRFECTLSAAKHGFVSRLEHTDLLAKHILPDDKPPAGYTEVAYLFGVFRGGGCALGFRVAERETIEWMCFGEPVDALLATAASPAGVKLFERVGELPRDEGSEEQIKAKCKGNERGHPEHKCWFKCLQLAWKPPMSLRITYHNRFRDMAREAAGGEDGWRRKKEAAPRPLLEVGGEWKPVSGGRGDFAGALVMVTSADEIGEGGDDCVDDGADGGLFFDEDVMNEL